MTWPVAWGDMDAFNHVNNTVYFRYFEHIRITCFEKIGFTAHMQTHQVGPILARTSCVFRLPLTYPDTVLCETRIDEIGDDRFTMKYRVSSQSKGAVAAEGDGRIICYDYANGRKTALPDSVRQALMALQ